MYSFIDIGNFSVIMGSCLSAEKDTDIKENIIIHIIERRF